MGLFFHNIEVAARTKAVTRIKISAEDAKRLSCAQCTLDKEPLGHPKMGPTGAEHPIFYFLGEAPGKTEDEQGKQFVGASGDLLRDRLPKGMLSKIRWNNTLRCRPPKNREPSDLELACCRHWQEDDITQTKPKIVVGFGNVPLSWALGQDRQISAWRGRRAPVCIGGHTYWFYPITHPAALLRSMNDRKKGDAYLRAFERDIERVFDDWKRGLPEPYVEDPKDYLAGIDCLYEYGRGGVDRIEQKLASLIRTEHAIDIETDRLRPYNKDARILSVALGTYESVFVFPWEHQEAQWMPREKQRIFDLVREYLILSGRKWAHHAKFEAEWFQARYGPDILYQTEWGDTYGQAHVLDERKGKGLDELCQIHFGFRLKAVSNIDVKNLAATPLREVLPYNGMDAKYTDMLRHVQTELLEEKGLTHVYELLHSATPGLVLMQAKGVVRNPPAIIQLDHDLKHEIASITQSISNDKDVVRFCNTGAKFNPTSNPNLITFFRDFLHIPHPSKQRQGGAWHPHGGESGTSYSVDEAVLSQFKHPVAAQVLALRTTQKNHSTYITPLKDGGKHVHGDGLLHSSFNNYVTVSGRLSSEDPNEQNFPRREHKEIRRAIGCPPNHKFVAFDYGQLEWRIGAMLSGDKNMQAEIWDGKDIHGDWTDMIGGQFVPARVRDKKGWKKVRDSIKQYWTFANLYGAFPDAVARDLSIELGVTITTATLTPSLDKFWGRYPNLLKYQQDLVSLYWELGYVETGTGQRRHEPMSRNEVINHPFQGSAGHLVIDTQSRLSFAAYEQDRPQLQPILNVHDDLSFYLPIKTLEENIETIARYMCTDSFDFVTVPLAVECSMGDNWCDKEEIHTFTTQDFT